tara:strand:- start:146 stop:487 length:342 start_codon:yes stop_codon:yes gene_type:complete
MPKKYSQEFLLNLNNLDGDRMGVQLAKACVNADLPITEVAKVFGVSRMTLHNWFRGAPIRDKNTQKIKAFLVALNQVWTDQFENHTEELPLSHQKLAKEFLETRIVSKLAVKD